MPKVMLKVKGMLYKNRCVFKNSEYEIFLEKNVLDTFFQPSPETVNG